MISFNSSIRIEVYTREIFSGEEVFGDGDLPVEIKVRLLHDETVFAEYDGLSEVLELLRAEIIEDSELICKDGQAQEEQLRGRRLQAVDIGKKVQGIIDEATIVVFSKSYCPHCKATKKLLK